MPPPSTPPEPQEPINFSEMDVQSASAAGMSPTTSPNNNNSGEEKSCRCSLLSLDIFKFDGAPRPISGPTVSIRGVAVTILMIMCMLGYVASSFYRFLTQPPAVSVTQAPTDDDRIPFVPFCVRAPQLSNPRYFAYQLQRNDVDAAGKKVKTTLTHYMNTTILKHGIEEVCIDPTTLGGNDDDDTAGGGVFLRNFPTKGIPSSTLKFKIWNCNNSDPDLPAEKRRPKSQCEKQKTIAELLANNFVQVYYRTPVGEVPVNCAPKFSGASAYASTFARNVTRSAPDLLREFRTHTTNQLISESTAYSLTYFYVNGVPDHELLEVTMSMGPRRLTTVISPQTMTDLVSSWGAFFGVLAGGFALLANNEDKFFEDNKAWCNLDGKFQVDLRSDEEIAREERERRKAQERNISGGYNY